MGQTTDQLREEIAAKREDAAAKIDQIEAKVQEIPQIARETVDASLQQARASVGETVNQMAQKMDLKQQVEQRPLVALGAALAGGWLLGKLVSGDQSATAGPGGQRYQRDRDQAHSSRWDQRADLRGSTTGFAATSGSHGLPGSASTGFAATAAGRGQQEHQGGGIVESIRGAARNAGLEDTLSALTGALVATLTDQVRQTIDQSFPEFGTKLRDQERSVRESRLSGSEAWNRTYGEGQSQGGMASGSGYAYGTSREVVMERGASSGAGTGPGEGHGYATDTARGTGVGSGTGASAGSWTGTPAGDRGGASSGIGGSANASVNRGGLGATEGSHSGDRKDKNYGPSQGMPGAAGHGGSSAAMGESGRSAV